MKVKKNKLLLSKTFFIFILLAFSCKKNNNQLMKSSLCGLNKLIDILQQDHNFKDDKLVSYKKSNDKLIRSALHSIDKLIYLLNNEYKPGDILIFKENKNPIHIGIVGYNHNLISLYLSSIKDQDIYDKIKQNPKVDAYRYFGHEKSIEEVKKIRSGIINQALLWKNRVNTPITRKAYDHGGTFNTFLNMKYPNIIQNDEQNDNIRKISNLLLKIKLHESFEDLMTLQYIKYALRSRTIPSINKGFPSCLSFILACIGTSLLNDSLQKYYIKDIQTEKNNYSFCFWPSIKYLELEHLKQVLLKNTYTKKYKLVDSITKSIGKYSKVNFDTVPSKKYLDARRLSNIKKNLRLEYDPIIFAKLISLEYGFENPSRLYPIIKEQPKYEVKKKSFYL